MAKRVELFELDILGRIKDICSVYAMLNVKCDFKIKEVYKYCKENCIDKRVFEIYADSLYETYIDSIMYDEAISIDRIEKFPGKFLFKHDGNIGFNIFGYMKYSGENEPYENNMMFIGDVILSDIGVFSDTIKEAIDCRESTHLEVIQSICEIENVLSVIYTHIKQLNEFKKVQCFKDWYKENEKQINQMLKEYGG